MKTNFTSYYQKKDQNEFSMNVKNFILSEATKLDLDLPVIIPYDTNTKIRLKNLLQNTLRYLGTNGITIMADLIGETPSGFQNWTQNHIAEGRIIRRFVNWLNTISKTPQKTNSTPEKKSVPKNKNNNNDIKSNEGNPFKNSKKNSSPDFPFENVHSFSGKFKNHFYKSNDIPKTNNSHSSNNNNNNYSNYYSDFYNNNSYYKKKPSFKNSKYTTEYYVPFKKKEYPKFEQSQKKKETPIIQEEFDQKSPFTFKINFEKNEHFLILDLEDNFSTLNIE